jgi:hypothetical protein
MKNTARNAIPINGTIEITSIPAMELYVVKGLFLTKNGRGF